MGGMLVPKRSPFPIRCAGMDVGSNAIRLAIAEFVAPTRYKILERMRVPIRLGESVFHTNRIAPETMDAALDAFRSFRRRMEAHGALVHHAVATSATREAKNRAVFLERVRSETGIDLDLITGTEEARLVALGVRAKVPLARGQSLILDVGGGSCELALVAHGEILLVESHDIGGVRLLERTAGAPPGRFLRLVQATLQSARFPLLDSLKRRGVQRLVGTGGNIETLAQIGSNGGGRDTNHANHAKPARLSVARLRRLLAELAKLEPAERARRYDLRPDRADVIVPVGAVFDYVAARIRAREVVVPFVGLVDGVLIDLAQAADTAGMKQLEISQTRNAALALLRKYESDPKHARCVAALAASLFDQLKPVHGLGKRERLLLEIAALLHEVGNFIGTAGHHRHAYYIISETPILGLGDEELHIVANVARYHRKAPPDLSHECYRDLPDRARQRVRALAAILRIADALDHDHRQRVMAVTAKARGSDLKLKIRTRGDATLDERSVGEKGDLFREEFGLKPVVSLYG